MKIGIVRLGAVKKPSPGGRPETLELARGATTGDALRAVSGESARERDYTLMIGTKAVSGDHPLREGDILYILRVLGGG